MQHEVELRGARFGLRPVMRADAAFILSLRTDPQLSRFLHRTSPKLSDQEAWIDAYLARPGDIYFIINDLKAGEPVGTIGLYDLDAATGEAEWGRWLVRRDSLGAVESALLIYRAAFEALELQAVYCRTLAGNQQVVSFHDSTGARRNGLLPGHVVLDGVPHDSVEHRVDRALWATMRPRLARLAQRVAEI